MKISKLYPDLYIKNNHKITKITNNSKNVIEGAIFVAVKGYTNNGENYIKEAIDKGAKTIIIDKNLKSEDFEELNNTNIIKVIDTKKTLATILTKYYNYKFKNFKIIGITGTNGKTTTCTLLHQYLRLSNHNVICFSSNGNYINDTFFPTTNTTPDITVIYDTIERSKFKKGFIIIEISSQAISELRVLGIKFDIVSITNITTDHLDYHKNITDYFYTKARVLFQLKDEGIAILNQDSELFLKLQSFITNQIITISEKNNSNFKYEIIESNLDNTFFIISNNDNIQAFQTHLIGNFNVQNICMVYAIINCLNISQNYFDEFIRTIDRIQGRMNIFNINKRIIIIDYAHTVEAVKASLKMINNTKKRSIKLVIGCGGKRDTLKRPIIGQLACLYADFVYFTEDNSRGESLNKILKEITCDLTSNNYMIIESRYKAIKKAVIDSKPDDIIVLMGKGYEKTLIEKEEYTDIEMIKKCFKEINGE